ncbi:MAG: hypothetical protein WA133_13070 [Syntrophales bacterium]
MKSVVRQAFATCRKQRRKQTFPDLRQEIKKSAPSLLLRALFLPIRCAITGQPQGPELDKLAAVLGKPTILKRLEQALRSPLT